MKEQWKDKNGKKSNSNYILTKFVEQLTEKEKDSLRKYLMEFKSNENS